MERSENNIEHNNRGLSWIVLKYGLVTDGCPICYLVKLSMEKYFEFLLYESATDASVHKKTIASFGMCNTHTYILKEIEEKLNSDGLNIAVLYETILQKEIKLLKKIDDIEIKKSKRRFFMTKNSKEFDDYKKEIISELEAKGICPGCEHQKQSETFYTHEILRLYKDSDFREKYENEKILLCRKHFLFLINESESIDAIKYFVEIQKSKISRLYEKLSKFIEKHDYRFKNEMTDDERNSWKIVLEYTGSKKNI